MSNCSTIDNRILPLSKIKFAHPEAIVKILNDFGITGCVLPIEGYCDTEKCDLYKEPNFNKIPATCDCNFFRLMVNIQLGLIESMYCVMKKSLTSLIAISNQDIFINIYSTGDLKNTKVKQEQIANVQIIDLNSEDIQRDLSNVSYEAYQDIIVQAGYDEELRTNPITGEVIQILKEHLPEMKEIFENTIHESILKIVKKTSVLGVSQQSIFLKVYANSINKFDVNIKQDALLKIMSENVTNALLGNVIQQEVKKKIDAVMERVTTDGYCKIIEKEKEKEKATGLGIVIGLGIIIVIAIVIVLVIVI